MTNYTYRVECTAPGERAVFEYCEACRQSPQYMAEVRFIAEQITDEGSAFVWYTVTLSRYPEGEPERAEELRRWER